MSGHSKWSKIKHQKATNDQAKSTIFAKLSKAITLAVVQGGGIGDPNNNVHLRLAIEKAKELNMPKDNIERAIEKGSGPNKQELKEYVYEAFGPSGSALLIVVATDNPNRTHSEVRNVLERNGGKVGTPGSVTYLFQHTGVIRFNLQENAEEAILAFAEQANATDFYEEEDVMTVYLPFSSLGKVKELLGDLKPLETDSEYKPLSTLSLSEQEVEKISSLIQSLEELEDVQGVYTNVIY